MSLQVWYTNEPAQLSVLWILGALSPGVKQLRREADSLPPSNVENFTFSCLVRLDVCSVSR
jgi:hypothetical protein